MTGVNFAFAATQDDWCMRLSCCRWRPLVAAVLGLVPSRNRGYFSSSSLSPEAQQQSLQTPSQLRFLLA